MLASLTVVFTEELSLEKSALLGGRQGGEGHLFLNIMKQVCNYNMGT